MNRKLSILAAGLALSATLTGCTGTAGYYRTAPITTPDPTLYGERYGVNRRETTERYRADGGGTIRNGRGTAGVHDRARMRGASGYVGNDGRWRRYAGDAAGVPFATDPAIASYPDPFGR